jgi:hypothetical protein
MRLGGKVSVISGSAAGCKPGLVGLTRNTAWT